MSFGEDQISIILSKVYRVSIGQDPIAFVFPRNEYGRVDVERAVLLGKL